MLAILLLVGAAALPARADDADEFMLRPVPGKLQVLVGRYGLEVLESFPQQNLYLVRPANDDFPDRAGGDDDVEGVERNDPQFTPEIPSGSMNPSPESLQALLSDRRMVSFYGDRVWIGFARQPATRLVGLLGARTRGTTGAGVVAVIDSGVDVAHPALRGALVEGYDFTRDVLGVPHEMNDVDVETARRLSLSGSTTAFLDSSTRPVPLNQYAVAGLSGSTTAFLDAGKLPQGFGHGTMVASLVRLAAPTARIMPLKAFDADGRSNTFDILRAIYHAADRRVQVVNMSFSMQQSSPELERAIRYAADRGVALVSAVGNDGNEIDVYPASLAAVIGVASTSLEDRRSPFTNYGSPLVSLAAPGEGVVAAYPGGNYATVWGTSFSAPLVAGALTLLVQRDPEQDVVELESALLDAARPLSEGGLGAGRLRIAGW
jgi:subtilisin family serine protease